MRASEQRLLNREAQTRSWAAPLPDFTSLPRFGSDVRVRYEWETRDSINNRMWDNMIDMGGKEVSPTMLASHPTAGAQVSMPSIGRQDLRHYSAGPEWERRMPTEAQRSQRRMPTEAQPEPVAERLQPMDPRMPGIQERPMPPPQSLFQNPWTDGFNSEGGGVAREMRGVVRETHRGWAEDSAGRISERTFQNQWTGRNDVNRIVLAQIDAAERLRPSTDDYSRSYRGE
jgi:hypothetical protein